jgi:NAD(P)H-dependent FMN reductase
VAVIAASLARLGHETSTVDLKQLQLAIYDGDEETQHGQPAGAQRLQALIHDHDALIIGCPEYNGYMTPLLLNAIDWAPRSTTASPDLTAFRDRPVLIVCASPGGMGGTRAAGQLRNMLSGIGCLVLPDTFSVPGAMQAFNEDGSLKDQQLQQRADSIALEFSEFTQSHVDGE